MLPDGNTRLTFLLTFTSELLDGEHFPAYPEILPREKVKIFYLDQCLRRQSVFQI